MDHRDHLIDDELLDHDSIELLQQVRRGLTRVERRWLRSLASGVAPKGELLILFQVCELGEQSFMVTPTVTFGPSPDWDDTDAGYARASFREGRRLLIDGEVARQANAKAGTVADLHRDVIIPFLRRSRTS